MFGRHRSESHGVTRGPDGDVYATDFVGQIAGVPRMHHWRADGTFVGTVIISEGPLVGPWGIVWAGNTIPRTNHRSARDGRRLELDRRRAANLQALNVCRFPVMSAR
jgi:hypothetical protein